MMTSCLFPHRYKRIGWVMASLALLLWLLETFGAITLPHLVGWLPSLIQDPAGKGMELTRENHDLYAVVFVVGAVMAACSRERQEDEYIGQIRLESLLWALYAYCTLLVLAFLLVSGMSFFTVMTYAMFAPLLLFLVRFHVVLRRSDNATAHAE
ncbi:hypothetical protein [Hymenobacter convexus]|uniref:hypothetical protein n=1 Tax=Hymenobacter sp. CA1UV-4 TaxID=3063782 RepID=UPI002712B75C|nr:hypothetical protein [Hymenobacter sp. CA1UV-4]MDO7850245.1 hypothetical protein [Hymenobacter sp. CA1UV-4]